MSYYENKSKNNVFFGLSLHLFKCVILAFRPIDELSSMYLFLDYINPITTLILCTYAFIFEM